MKKRGQTNISLFLTTSAPKQPRLSTVDPTTHSEIVVNISEDDFSTGTQSESQNTLINLDPEPEPHENEIIAEGEVLIPECPDVENVISLSDKLPYPVVQPSSIEKPESPSTNCENAATIQSLNLDIGSVSSESPSQTEIEKYVTSYCSMLPSSFPKDIRDQKFPEGIFKYHSNNGEQHIRDWLVWSEKCNSLFCFPCRLFFHTVSNQSALQRSKLASPNGWTKEQKWRKLVTKIPQHEKSTTHRECYMAWRELERRLSSGKGIEHLLESAINSEVQKWIEILKRIIDVVIFLGCRGLAFTGTSHRIGDSKNGNFLGIIELLAKYDPVLREHVTCVEKSQEQQKRMQAHYLSPESQNEFIAACSDLVMQHILQERRSAKYYAVIADATPDISHKEQTTFLLRYLSLKNNAFEVEERFLLFNDVNAKSGEEIANLILNLLEKHGIPLEDCRGQGYDNGSNMSGKYNGAQAKIIEQCPTALFSPCGCHTLNLCGADSAECIPDAITFFGTVQSVNNLFSCSPKRWEILMEHLGCSLHSISGTRWSERIESIKPFTTHLPGVKTALEKLLNMKLPPKAKVDAKGALTYVNSFVCVFMSAVWFKILSRVDICMKVIQARQATLDVELANVTN